MAQIQTSEIALLDNGDFLRRDIYETKINVTDEVLAKISANIPIKVTNILEIPNYGKCGLSVQGQEVYFTVPIPFINLRCPFIMDSNGVLTPQFDSKTDTPLEIRWVPQDSGVAKVVMMIGATHRDAERKAGKNSIYTFKVWLVAIHDGKIFYRLPLSNVYGDCAICTGRTGAFFPTFYELVYTELKTFEASRWNADLWDSPKETGRLFRFKPEGKGFIQLAPLDQWWNLSRKVSITAFRNLVY